MNSDYKRLHVVKAIVENQEGKMLLVQEPETHDWMPEHWGLPGGKPDLCESLRAAFKRRLKEELGFELEPQGLFRVEELLLEDQTILMFTAVAKVVGEPEFTGMEKAYKWVGIEEVTTMEVTEFTEYYDKNLILDYLSGNREDFVSFDLLEPQHFYDLDSDPNYQKWLKFEGKEGVRKDG